MSDTVAAPLDASRIFDKVVGITLCFLVWSLPTALFAALGAWGAYAFDKQTLQHWTQTVHTSTRHVSVVTSTYHHGLPSIVVISLLLGCIVFMLSAGFALAAFALWDK